MNASRMHKATLNNTEIVFTKLDEEPGFEAFEASGGANTAATIAGAMRVQPMLSWETQDLKTLLDLVPLTGYAITGVSNSKFLWHDAVQAEGGVFASGSVHRLNTLTKGLFVIETISGQGNQIASASGKIYAVYDGTNAPVIRQTTQALSSTLARLANVWVGGKVALGGTDLETQGWTLNVAPDVMSLYQDGGVFPRLAGIRSYKVEANIETLDPVALDKNDLSEDTVLYLVKHDPDTGARVAAATEEHIAFTIPRGYEYAGSARRAWGQESNFSATLKGVFDGTNAIVSVDTTAAIA